MRTNSEQSEPGTESTVSLNADVTWETFPPGSTEPFGYATLGS